MQFRKPQISIPNSTNHFVISAQESRSQGEELVALPSRIHQDPSPAQTGTDQLRTEYWSSSVNLFLVPFLIFFLIWLPIFPSTISESYYHMFSPQTWHNLGLHSPELLHTSLNEPPLNDAVFAPLVNLYWPWLGLISHISSLGHICLNQIHLFSWDPYYPCHLLANQSLKECSKVVPLFIIFSPLVCHLHSNTYKLSLSLGMLWLSSFLSSQIKGSQSSSKSTDKNMCIACMPE